MVNCKKPFSRKCCRTKEMTRHFAMTAGGGGDLGLEHVRVRRACLAPPVFGLMEFGEAKAICTRWSMGG